MLVLYRIAIWSYGFLIRVFSLFNEKAAKFRNGRKDWVVTLKSDINSSELPTIWVHAASLGEFEQGRPIIEALKKGSNECNVLLTFFSPSGYEVRRDYEFADWVYYLPLDSPRNAREFVSITKPAIAVFIKYEFWYFYLKELSKRAIPTIMVSSIFRKNQLFFHWSGAFFRPVFGKVTHFFVQDTHSAELISQINQNVTIAGDTRFDRVIEISEEAKQYKVVEDFLGEETCFMIGSSWPSDMEVLAPLIKKFQEEVKFIIAPHNLKEEEIASIASSFNRVTRYSDPVDLPNQHILIIDNMGMLSSLYRYADYAFIGGGFRGALHNTLEAAVFGIPILFGRHENNTKFREAIELEDTGGAFSIASTEELLQAVESLKSDPSKYQKAASASGEYVRSKSGATQLIMRKIEELL